MKREDLPRWIECFEGATARYKVTRWEVRSNLHLPSGCAADLDIDTGNIMMQVIFAGLGSGNANIKNYAASGAVQSVTAKGDSDVVCSMKPASELRPIFETAFSPCLCPAKHLTLLSGFLLAMGTFLGVVCVHVGADQD
jgi:hypothetical protein